MSDTLLVGLVILLAVVGSYLFGGVRGWKRNRLLGIVFLVVVGVVAVRCGLV
jgi:uncharacterized membrane protein SirB2